MDRLAHGGGAHGWIAFDGAARDAATRIAEEAKRRGHDARTFLLAAKTRVVVSFPEGDATVDFFEVPQSTPKGIAICRKGERAAVEQTRALVRETLERGDFGQIVACDEATWKTLPELGAHRAAVSERRTADVFAALGWIAAVPAALVMGLVVFLDLSATNMTCGPEPAGTHAGWILGLGLVGLALFAIFFVPAVLLLRISKRSLARSIFGTTLAGIAVFVAIADFFLLSIATLC